MPAPVDIPTFYNRGPDSVSHPQADSTRFHSTNSLTMQSSSSLLKHNLPSTSIASSAQPIYETFPMSYDMVASQNTQYTERQQWDDTDYRFAPPISSARSSIDCTLPRPSDPELSWAGTHARRYDCYGQESPQSSFNSHNEHVPLFCFQPHMNNRSRPTHQAPFSSSVTTSSKLYQRSLPQISTVSPYASSDSSSSSSSPLSTPEITIRTPITVHQPRPSRRIPIVSLSELASACDVSMSSTREDAIYQKPSRELLSPLTTNISANYTPPYSPIHSLFSDAYTAPTHLFKDSEEVVICSCGCMGSYTITQNL
ncbi:hypothetical protein L208DRAFT_734590 [Tricholoma matsutake]|nr:hypothetical protein L208DRAFT_734590 [Tricholoma matsutake 945]